MPHLDTIHPENFQREVLQSPVPVILEFGATWCQPCKRLEPILEQLAQRWQAKARFARIDVDEGADIAMRYQVMGVPTVILFSGGAALERVTGLQPLERLAQKFEGYLK